MTKKKLMMMAFAAVAAAFGAWAETETVGDYTWTYQINGDTAEIYKSYLDAAISPKPTGAVTIPSTLGGKPVTSIGYNAFYNCSSLTSVTIGNGVTSIGYNAFYNCSSLTSVTIPDSVTSIGNSAFSGCNDSLFDTTTIPGVKLVDGWAVGHTDTLSGDLDLTGIRGIGDWAFEGCSGLTSVTIPDSVTSIGNYAFSGCRSLTSVTIGNGVTSIGDVAFSGCRSLASVTIPDSVTSIGWAAFSGCRSLASVTIPDSVTSIGDRAFYDCSGLTSVTIPDSVTSIGDWAFSGCSGLTAFAVGSGNPSYKAVSGLLLTKDGKTLVAGVNGNVTIPDSVTSIGSSAFYGCSGLTSVTIPDGVTSIGSSAFYGCSGLTSVTIPDSVTSIESYAFYECSGLTSVTIPDSVMSIGDDAFYGCNGLTNVTIGNGVTSIGSSAFEGCSGIKNVTVPFDVMLRRVFPSAYSSITNVSYSTTISHIGGHAFENCYSLMSVTIPDSVTSIGNYAFEGCIGLTSVTIPEGVTSIGNYAFWGCRGLTSVMIPEGVANIGDGAFDGCGSLANVTIPDSVTSIGNNAFYACSGIKDVTVSQYILDRQLRNVFFGSADWSITNVLCSSAVTNIGDSAFEDCHMLTSVTIPDSVTSIGGWAFYNCDGLTSVTIPDSVTIIGDGAFLNCNSLTSVTIPDSVTSIGEEAFYGCDSLTSVTIGNGVTSIGERSFDWCSSLTRVTMGNNVTSIGDSAFEDCHMLTSVTIPDSVMSIGYRAFSGCGRLTAFIVGSGNSNYKSINGLLLSKDGNTLVWGVNGNVTIPDTVTSIGDFAFEDCRGLTSVTIPDSVMSIGDFAFYACSSLTDVMIPGSVTSIGDYAFAYCSGLASVTIPSSVTSIGQYAVVGCRNLSSVMFQGDHPNSVSSTIYENGQSNLTTYVSRYRSGWADALSAGIWNGRPIVLLDRVDDEPPFDCSENHDGTVTLQEYKGIAVDEIYILSSIGGRTVSAIAGHAFESCSGLRSVTIPATIVWLDDETFAGCSSLASVIYLGDAPDTGKNIYKGTPRTLVSYVTGGTLGWSGGISTVVPEIWNDRGISCEWTVTFDAQDGTSGEATRAVTNGCAVGELPAATRDGYEFLGWRMGSGASGDEVTASTIVTADMTVYASWRQMFEVAFYNNKGLHVLLESRSVGEGLTIGALPDAPEFGAGYSFAGWREVSNPKVAITTNTVVTGDMVVYAICDANTYTLFLDAQGGDCSPASVEVEYGEEIGELPNPTFDGYTFDGWYIGDMKLTATTLYETAGDSNALAHWTKNAEPTPTPTPTPELYEETEAIAGVVPATAASEYNGYLVSTNGNVAGSIQVKIGKANAKTGLASVKATVVGLDGKKKSLKAAEKGKAAIAVDGPTTIRLVGGEPCEVTLGAEGLSGTYGSYLIDGARNFFTSKDKGEQGAANAILSKWLGAVNVAWREEGAARSAIAPYQTLSVTIGKKGKAKVYVTLANGTKAMVNTQLLIGEEWLCVPVVVTKKVNLAFTLWLPVGGGAAVVEGLSSDMVVGKAGALKAGAKFRIDAEAFSARWGQRALPYLPDGVAVTANGTRWMLPKAGKVQMAKDGTVDEAKLGGNPAALKLTYKAKDGSFKGSFKAYSLVNGKPKAVTVNVAGVVIDGVGYGTATVKKVGSVPISIE